MKKLRITVEGRPFDVTVEVLADDAAPSSEPGSAQPATPVVSAPAVPSAASAAAFPSANASKPAATSTKPQAAGANDILSQISGVVVSVEVAAGDRVSAGQKLVTIEAMKMNTYVLATSSGTVAEVLVSKGKNVVTGDVLIRLS